MNWYGDPEVQRAMEAHRARNRLLRTAIIWTPLFVVTAAGFLFFLFDRALNDGDYGGTWFLVVVLGILSFLFGFQGIQALLDLFGSTRELEGVVTRHWRRTDSFVLRSYFVRLEGGKVFQVDALHHEVVRQGDIVRVTYHPRSATVVHLEKLPAAAKDEQDA